MSEDTLESLAATLELVRETQRNAAEFNMNAFKRIMEKLDVLPSIQTDVAVTKEVVANLKIGLAEHKADDVKNFGDINDDLKDLNRDKWVRHGMSTVIGALAGFAAGFIHR